MELEYEPFTDNFEELSSMLNAIRQWGFDVGNIGQMNIPISVDQFLRSYVE